ncbi:MAG: bifunctional 5,10-methylenetetrahydrofolate dehydrogenase/5,10-methenyltetrahydrofolate cyclohydrolase [Methanosarcinales archaeon]
MKTRIIDGKKIAEQIYMEIREEINRLKGLGITPGLVFILVGDDPASKIYVQMKEKRCKELGILSKTERMPEDISENELISVIKKYNNDPSIHGILIQLPLPGHIQESSVLSTVDPRKDVDGFNPENMGMLMLGEERYIPCTPKGILELIYRSGFEIEGKNVVIIGRSNIVGKPLANLLVQKRKGRNATVSICHTGTKNLDYYTKNADILIVAAGCPNFIKGHILKKGCIIIDVGINRVEDASHRRGYRIVGDVDVQSVMDVAGAITPVPGGVGPMTIAMLMENTLLAVKNTHPQGWMRQ